MLKKFDGLKVGNVATTVGGCKESEGSLFSYYLNARVYYSRIVVSPIFKY